MRIVFSVLLIYTLIALIPFSWVILNSFKNNTEIFNNPFGFPKQFLFNNYTEAWTTGKLMQYMRNSFIIAIPTTLGTLAVSSLAGYAFGRIKFWGNNLVFSIFLFGLMIPFEAIVIPLYFILKGLGLLESYAGVIIPGIGGPFGIFLMRNFFRQIPLELSDSARIDGCGEFRIFLYIMLPLAKPALGALAIFSFMGNWNSFLFPYIVLTNDAKRPLQVGLLNFQQRYYTDYRLLFSAIVLSMIPVIFLYILFHRQFIQGIASGALKE